ncbi:hypothetical protein ACFYTC_14290 [Actinomadura nitritigenes]|uniref:hypothetical protein n=1 Tax=Actinomadura nitritigenes TaxID=134602 RepID=UPI003676F49E
MTASSGTGGTRAATRPAARAAWSAIASGIRPPPPPAASAAAISSNPPTGRAACCAVTATAARDRGRPRHTRYRVLTAAAPNPPGVTRLAAAAVNWASVVSRSGSARPDAPRSAIAAKT